MTWTHFFSFVFRFEVMMSINDILTGSIDGWTNFGYRALSYRLPLPKRLFFIVYLINLGKGGAYYSVNPLTQFSNNNLALRISSSVGLGQLPNRNVQKALISVVRHCCPLDNFACHPMDHFFNVLYSTCSICKEYCGTYWRSFHFMKSYIVKIMWKFK